MNISTQENLSVFVENTNFFIWMFMDIAGRVEV